MQTDRPVVLVVDDDRFNLDLINDFLSEVDIDTVCVDSGENVLSILTDPSQHFSAVLLDRMMPGIDGLEVLSRIKSDKKICRLPVILQTGKVDKESMLEGLDAGAHYYLSKPYDEQTLVAIVSTAIRDYQSYIDVSEDLKRTSQTLKLMDNGVFKFKTISEGRDIVAILANACDEPDSAVLGLTELMINAIEHGNLGITYEEKSALNLNGQWEQEILRRSQLSSYSDKYVTIEFTRGVEALTFLISDEGSGFDWSQYMEISPNRVFDSHGRGIAMSNLLNSNQIEYLGIGNKVCFTVPIGM